MLNHSHRQLLLSILTYHKIHACHSLQIGSFRCWNWRQLPRNRNVNFSAVSESHHLGLIPTDIIVTDYAQWLWHHDMEATSALLALCGGNLWIPITTGQWCALLKHSSMLGLSSCWTNSQVTGDSRFPGDHVICVLWQHNNTNLTSYTFIQAVLRVLFWVIWRKVIML